ncbi:MAG: septal ring lytic transglycosylase RlpA family lipoprotein [Xanthomonadales bacterium]|nr:septal ring lytic transglycosylase RlpA family lipoprotein [Xanthomonadales bacterium]
MRLSAGTAMLVTALVVAGCASQSPSGGNATNGGGYYQNDGPPEDEDIDLSKIPDAVPRNVPHTKYGNPPSYSALGKRYYVLDSAAGFTQTGRASWYGRQFHGERTSSGEPYNMFSMTAAHKRLPLPTWVEVTNLANGRHCVVKVNDRGPFHDGRIIDLSYVAARRLGVVAQGSAPVRIRTVTPEDYRRPRATSTEPAPPLRAAANNNTSAVALGYLQVGAFSVARNARRLHDKLIAAGLGPVRIVMPAGHSGLYRVQVGPFADIEARRRTARTLIARGLAVRQVDG